jgi:hypothetical protein
MTASETGGKLMADYTELILELRKVGRKIIQFGNPIYNEATAQRMLDAADAIEELSVYVQQLEELRKDGWYLQKTKMMTYGQATMTQPLPQPPKEG